MSSSLLGSNVPVDNPNNDKLVVALAKRIVATKYGYQIFLMRPDEVTNIFNHIRIAILAGLEGRNCPDLVQAASTEQRKY